jgi:glycosyltransferase involved in cell wall biosynthesis
VISQPLVSVVVPVRNGERFLGEALDSVLAQDYEPVELIVVDDGSTDGSGDIAGARGAHVIRQEGGGLAAARNAGLAAAQGELVAFIDADDVWLPGKLVRQVEYLLDRPDVGFRAPLAPSCPWLTAGRSPAGKSPGSTCPLRSCSVR